MTWDNDTQYTAERIDTVETYESGWILGFGGASLLCSNDQCQQAPQPGETVRLYGKGLGYPVRGIIIECRVYRYLSEGEQEQNHAEWCAGQERSRAAALVREWAERDARAAALPEVFQERLRAFAAARPNFRRDHEPYELSVCEEAAKLGAHFAGDPEGLCVFSRLTSSEQMVTIPTLDLARHSGNSWGVACHLAYCFILEPAQVVEAHGALCPLVGCEELGCYAARREATPVPTVANHDRAAGKGD